MAKPVVVLGAGRVGRRALNRLRDLGFDRLTAVDQSKEALAGLGPGVRVVKSDGPRWLSRMELDSAWIVPAAPVHVAFEWLRATWGQKASPAEVPAALISRLPGAAPAPHQGWAFSWADFICPAECDERGVCPVLGRRLEPLFERLRLFTPWWPLVVIRSHRLGPGLGGFPAASLKALGRRAKGGGLLVVATACRCHGVMHALELD